MHHQHLRLDPIFLLGHGGDEAAGHRAGQHLADDGHERLLPLLRVDQDRHSGVPGTQRANRLPGRGQEIRPLLLDQDPQHPAGEVAQESRPSLQAGRADQQLLGSGHAHDHRQRLCDFHHHLVRDRSINEGL